jgi:hypothetical protein
MSAIREVSLHSFKDFYGSIRRTSFRAARAQRSETHPAASEEQIHRQEETSTRRRYLLLLEALNGMA